MSRGSPRNGFSLVELSIVLVILGLLTGGILAGQSLIRAAELRSAVAEYQRYTTAIQTFRDKYMAIPGDMNNATRFWNRQTNDAWCATNSAAAVAAPGTCDGDGNGITMGAAAISQSAEAFQFWRQMAFAGLIEGTYTGLSGTGNAYHFVIGENCPASKLSNGGWGNVNYSTSSGDTALFDGINNNTLVLGAQASLGGLNTALLKPEEMWNIDTKLDDGAPATGRIVVRVRANCALTAAGAALTTAAADAAKLDAVYNLGSSSALCVAIFRQAY